MSWLYFYAGKTRHVARRQAMLFKRLHFNFTTSVFLSVLSVLLLAAVSAGQAPPKYDPATEVKFKGTVEELRLPPKGNEKDVAHLTIKAGADTFDLYLCPKAFMDDMGVSFAKGDELAFTGSKVKQGGAEMILAREVVKGSDTVVLRDDKGNPVWSWRK
jgi:hypothetical protein